MTTRGRFGRLWARITGQWHLERLAAVEEKVAKFGRAQREELGIQRERLDGVSATLATRASAESLRDVSRRLEDLHVAFAQQDRAFSEAFERSRLLDEQGVDDRRLARRVEAFLRHDRPVIVGPWTGEVGFELLYWVPFVRRMVAVYGLPPERLIVVSRGGVAPWYGALATDYSDVFSFFSPGEFRAATEARKKQRLVGAFDVDVVKRVVAARKLGRVDMLHPGMMYRLFMPVWKDLATCSRVDKYAAYEKIDAADVAVPPGLPASYVAARFYFSDCFPDTPENRAFVVSTINTISRQTPVVLLNTPFAVDDHHDFDAAGDRVFGIAAEHMAPEQNLAVQTAVIARARAFVGTYGGYAYLAPLCGVPSLAFYSHKTFKVQHLNVAQRAFEQLVGPSLVTIDVSDLALVHLALASGVHAG
ncbi:MAG: hypothetical protein O2930_00745 [Acidobacteria bacterium]|nr:hypothetical protein [Acidobacteriota bacterium]